MSDSFITTSTCVFFDHYAPGGMAPKRREPNRKANLWTARIIPIVLLAIIVYSTWVITKIICIDYLLTSRSIPYKPATQAPAIVILVLYYLLLFPLLICYARLMQTIITNPGYVPRSQQWYVQKAEKDRLKRKQRSSQRWTQQESDEVEEKHRKNKDKSIEHGAGEDDFWHRDLFICQYDGRPPFCSQCFSWKLDRDHHCREVNRCVRKMDHFCPWVGGIISETSFKFFIQFVFYTAIFCGFDLIFIAYYFAQHQRLYSGTINAHWTLVLAFSALFFLFGIGMFGSTIQLTYLNTTTVENLSRRSKTHYIAVHLPRPEETIRQNEAAGNPPLRTIDYPRPPEEQAFILQQHGAVPTSSPSSSQPFTTAPPKPQRTFAIIETTPGQNPWVLGPIENLKSVLGDRLIDWFLPIRYSPCTNHDSKFSMYKINPDVLRQIQKTTGVVLNHDGGAAVPTTNGTGSWGDERRHRRRERRQTRRTNRASGGAAEASAEGEESASASDAVGEGRRHSRRRSRSRRKRYPPNLPGGSGSDPTREGMGR